MRTIAMLLVFLACAFAQEEPDKAPPKKNQPAGDGKYENKDLGVAFSGIYGWEVRRAEGSGAWTMLVRYSDADYDADAELQVRDNPFSNTAELKAAIAAEFKEGGEATAETSVYKEISIQPVEMKRGNELPGFDVEGYQVSVSEEGKKRERAIFVRTYFGANRLFRVHCTVRRSRLKNVQDLFVRAAASLEVTAAAEKVTTGVPFVSSRGGWNCIIPEAFVPDLPPPGRNYDMQFVGQRGAARIYVYAYAYQGTIQDQLADLLDFYGEDLKVVKEGFKRAGGESFDALLTKDDRVTLIAAVVRDRRAYRVHTSGAKAQEADLAEIHKRFLEGFRLGR